MNDFTPDRLLEALATFGSVRGGRYCVAFSGGLDSTVLLCALARLAGQQPGLGHLRAVHVHHGLHPRAGDWADACRTRCAALGVPLDVLEIDARPARGESPEARARELRYAALRDALQPGEALLTAHHADDQLETVLIQLLRGAGVAGLAAMAPAVPFGAGQHLRPLLRFSRADLSRWAETEGLGTWIEDPANANRRYPRNHLRHEIVPVLRAHWPSAANTVARAARHCAEAAGMLDELAEQDAAVCAVGPTLELAALMRLSPARRRNLIRWQLRRLGLALPDERRLGTLLGQMETAAHDTGPRVEWADVVAWRHDGRLWLIGGPLPPALQAPLAWPEPRQPLVLGAGLGRLVLESSTTGGLRAEATGSAPWRVTGRRGGERLRISGRAGSRPLKKLLNEARVPPWVRARMPLVEIGGQLAAVGGEWVDERWWAPPGAAAWRLRWEGFSFPA